MNAGISKEKKEGFMKAFLSVLVFVVSILNVQAEVTKTSMLDPNTDFELSEEIIVSLPTEYNLKPGKVNEVLDYSCLASDNVEAKCSYDVTWSSVFCAKGVSSMQIHIYFQANGIETMLEEADSTCIEEKYTNIK